jgi:hypothetical protein
MIDVHPPQHAAITLRDFFIHLGIVVLGILIAIGLEQTVELFHHRHQLREAREQIRAEIQTNLEWQRDVNGPGTKAIAAHMGHNIAILRAAEENTPAPDAVLDFSWKIQGFNDGAYRSASQNGAIALLPYDESEAYGDMYEQQQITLESALALIAQVKSAQSITMRGHTLAQMSPAELQELLAACSAVQGKAVAFSEWGSEFTDEAHITLNKLASKL